MRPSQFSPQRGPFLLCCLLFFFFIQSISGQVFEKNYGNPLNNSFGKVIKDGTNYYVLGANQPTAGALPRATVTRLNANGSLQWTLTLDIASVWNDAVLTPTGDLMVVGNTLPFDANSESLLARVTPQNNGSFGCLRRYNVEGREGFFRIVRNPAPESPAFPYYILGGQFQPGGTTMTDDVVLLNVDKDCNINWKKSISTENDDEWLRAMEVLPNGDLLVCGNDETFGKIFRTSNSGVVNNGVQIGDRVFRDITENDAGEFLAAAVSFTGNQAFIYKFDQDLILLWNAQIPQLTTVSQIWEAAPGIIYVVGNGFFNSAARDVIIKIDNTDPLIVPVVVWVKYYSAGSNFSGGSAWYLPPNQMAYTDKRVLPNGFGGDCAFMSVSDLELDACLVTTTTAQLEFLSPLPDGPPFPLTESFPLPMGVMFNGQHLMYDEELVCGEPCAVDINITPINPCGFVQVCATATGPSPYDYQWCDGQNTPCFNTQLDWGDNTFCVSVTCSDGTMASTSLTYNFAETVPPTIMCPPHLQLACGDDLTPATTGMATATDNCDPSPSITYTDMIFGSLPCDALVQRTWVAEDACGNISGCVQNINIIDNVPPVISNCPPSQSVIGTFNPNGICEASVTIGVPTATDNCDPSVTVTNDFNNTANASGTYPQGSTTVVWTATDDCGNTDNCSLVITVECEEDCTCGTYSDMSYRPSQGAPNIAVMCNDTLIAQCDGPIPWTLGGDFLCAGNSCPPTTAMTWTLTSPTNVVSSGSMKATSGFNLSIPAANYNENGCYQLRLQAICGQDTCYCDFVVKVECDTCCTDFEAFCDKLDQEVTITVDDELCKATVNVGDIGPCDSYLEYVDWGDGTTETGPYPPGAMPMHTYSASGTYEICYLAIELDNDGFICFEKIVCDSITLVCGCCTDFEAFCDKLDQEVTITVDDELCKATVNVGDIGPCDSYLEYVDWGDGTTETGPYPPGAMPMHTYTGSGSYEICYLAIELGDDGFNCFEKIVCDSIVLECLCCTDSTAFFAAAPTIPTNGTLGDCFLSFQATDLDDCWQISYLWGDQPVVWDGPYPNNTSVTHQYQNAGLYNVCYRLEEIDADSMVCWEYIQCMDVKVLCPDTCALPPYEDMVAWWPMDEQDGQPTVVDIIGSNNAFPQPGGFVGNPNGPAAVPGKVGGALHFTSPGNTHLSVNNNLNINFGNGSFSIDAWIKTSPGTQTEPIVDKLGVTDNGYALSVQGTVPHFLTLVLGKGTGNGVNVLTGPAIIPDEWNFVAVTVSPPNVTFYVKNSQGLAQSTVAIPGGIISTTNNSRPLLIGANVQNPHWNIMIDELEIFNRDLTPAEIIEICSADSLGKCPPPNLGCLCNALANEVHAGFSVTAPGIGLIEFQPIGSLSDCDEVTWTWGDGTMEGTSIGGAAIQHDYGDSGLFNVCMSVVRTQDAGQSCTQSICIGIVGVGTLADDSAVRLYPNPTAGELSLEFEDKVPVNGQLQVLDLFGRVVQKASLPAGADRYTFSVATLPAGVYVVKVLAEGSVVWVTKIVKL